MDLKDYELMHFNDKYAEFFRNTIKNWHIKKNKPALKYFNLVVKDLPEHLHGSLMSSFLASDDWDKPTEDEYNKLCATLDGARFAAWLLLEPKNPNSRSLAHELVNENNWKELYDFICDKASPKVMSKEELLDLLTKEKEKFDDIKGE